MESLPVVSIVVPVFNAENYLGRLLDSVRKQTFQDYELILVNDGSSDRSAEILEKYRERDSRLHVMNQENSGAAAARNRGIEKANGEYITFLDADDEIESEMLQEMVADAKKNQSDLVVCGIYLDVMDQQGQVVSSSLMAEPAQVVVGNQEIRKYVIKTMNTSIMYSPCNKLYLSSIIKTHSIKMRTDIDIGEDLVFNLQYLKYVRVLSMLPNGYYHYYQRATGENLMAQFRQNKADIMEEWFRSLHTFAEGIPDPYIIDFVSWMKIRWFFSCFIEMAGSSYNYRDKREYIKEIVKKECLGDIKIKELSFFQKALTVCIASRNITIIYAISYLVGFYKQKYKNQYYKRIIKQRNVE